MFAWEGGSGRPNLKRRLNKRFAKSRQSNYEKLLLAGELRPADNGAPGTISSQLVFLWQPIVVVCRGLELAGSVLALARDPGD